MIKLLTTFLVASVSLTFAKNDQHANKLGSQLAPVKGAMPNTIMQDDAIHRIESKSIESNIITPKVIREKKINVIDSERELEMRQAKKQELLETKEGLQEYQEAFGVPAPPANLSTRPLIQNPNTNRTLSRNASDLFFSEVSEGSGTYNKYLEIYNGTGADVDMSNYMVGVCNNGNSNDNLDPNNPSTWYEGNDTLSGTLADGDVFVISRDGCDATILAQMDLDAGGGAGSMCSFGGNDWVGLFRLGNDGTETLLDAFGTTPTTESPSNFDVAGVSGGCSNNTLIRKSSVMSGNTDWASSAGTNADDSEWLVMGLEYWDDLGTHTFANPTALLISEYCDYATDAGARFLEIYNPTDTDVELDGNVYVARYSNGSTSSYSISLVGTVAAGDVHVVANSTDFDVEFGFSADQYSSAISGNGDDVFALSTSGYPDDPTPDVFDVLGEIGVDGTGTGWEHLDQTIVRNPGYGPSTTLSLDEWSVGAGDATFATPGSHVFQAEEDGPYLTEGFEGEFPPAGWSLLDGSADWQQGDGTYYGPGAAGEGSYSAYFDVWNYFTGSVGQMLSPPMDFTNALNPSLKFSHWNSSGSDYVAVYATVDGGTNWDLLQVLYAGDAEWTEYSISLAAYVGQPAVWVNFYAYSDYGSSNPNIDMVSVSEPPSVPVASLSADALDFGAVNTSATASLDLSVDNLGGGELSGTMEVDNAKFTLSASSLTLAPGESGTVTVTYTPTDEMDDVGSLTFTHNADGSPNVVALSGSGTASLIVESFEGALFPPNGWQVANADAANPNSVTQSSTQAFDGLYSARFSSYSSSADYTQYMMTPMVTLPADNPMFFKFMHKGYSSWSSEEFSVGVSTTDTDPASFTFGDLQYSTADWAEASLDLSSYAGQGVYLAIKYTSNYLYYMYVDHVTVEPAPTQPILQISTDAMAFYATMLDSSRMDTLLVANVGSGDLSGTLTYTEGWTGPATFSSTDSELYISYSPTTYGHHSGTLTITSNGGDATVSLSGNAGKSVATWDDDADGDGIADWPAGWEVNNLDGGLYEWDFYGGGGHTGDGYTSVRYESSSLDNNDWLISPAYDVVAGDLFTFFSKDYGYSGDYMSVLLSPTGDLDPASFTVELADSVTDQGSSWLPNEFDLSAYAGTQVRVAIVYTGSYAWYLYVDDIAGPEVYQASGPLVYDYPTSLDFGLLELGQTDTAVFDYFNVGGSELSVTDVTFEENSGAYSLSSTSSLPVNTAPNSIGSFHVVFTPTMDGAYVDTMVVTHNAGDALRIPLSGSGLEALYYETFNGYYDPWDATGWAFSDNGVLIDPAVSFTNGTGAYWLRTAFSSDLNNAFLYHTYASFDDLDTAFVPTMELTAVEGAHYELSYSEYNFYGTDADTSVIAISTDGGVTYETLAEANLGVSGWSESVVDLSAYDGMTVDLAFVYHGNFGNVWAMDDLIVKSYADPVVPVAVVSTPVFAPTMLGASDTAMLYVSNVGNGDLTATVSYPASMSGPTDITALAVGETDTLMVVYMPTVSGLETEMIEVDGRPVGAELVMVTPEANAGEMVYDFVNESPRWKQYDFFADDWEGYTGSWTWFGGVGHSSANYYGVGTSADNWGGSDDWLVSPRFEVQAGDAFSFWALSTSNAGVMEEMAVYVSTEMPQPSFEDSVMTNFDSFVQLSDGMVPLQWTGYGYDLSAYEGDEVYLMIHSYGAGWYLQVDDFAQPQVWMNPNPVQSVGKSYDFGVTSPDGDVVAWTLRNTGSTDLVVDSMEFAHGHNFHLADHDMMSFPLTLSPDSSVTFDVVFEPETYGMVMDTLHYFSNYTSGDVDAYGSGTDMSVFKGDAFNNPPNAFMLFEPMDGMHWDLTDVVDDPGYMDLDTVMIDFLWQPTIDQDNDPVEFFFESNAFDTEDMTDELMELDMPYNMAYNSSFEDSLMGWETFPLDAGNVQLMTTGDDMHNSDETFMTPFGDHAVKMYGAYNGTYPNYTDLYQNWPLEMLELAPGMELRVHGFLMSHSDDWVGQGLNSGYLYLQYFDATGAIGSRISDLMDASKPANEWLHFTLTDTVPEGALSVSVGVEFYQHSEADGGSVYYDEVTLHVPLTGNSLTLDASKFIFDALEDSVNHVTVHWNVYAQDTWDETPSSNGPFAFSFDLTELLGIDEGNLPKEFALHNNYPNPFNPVTNITYDIPEVANVKLEIFNIVGQKVRTLAQGSHEPGRYRVLWDATNDLGEQLSSGMYVYRIQAGDFVGINKLILMK